MSILSVITRKSALALVLAGSFVGCAGADEAVPEDNQPEEQAQRTVAPGSSGIQIADVTTQGTGCPSGSAEASISDDGLAFTLTFAKYQINLEPTDKVDSTSLNCDVTVKLKTPAGLSFAVTEFAYQGYASLERGVVASVRANYHFQGGRDAVLGNPNPPLPSSPRSRHCTGATHEWMRPAKRSRWPKRSAAT